MTQRQRKHRLNVSRREDVRYPWLRLKDWKPKDVDTTTEIGRVERVRFITSPMLEAA